MQQFRASDDLLKLLLESHHGVQRMQRNQNHLNLNPKPITRREKKKKKSYNLQQCNLDGNEEEIYYELHSTPHQRLIGSKTILTVEETPLTLKHLNTTIETTKN